MNKNEIPEFAKPQIHLWYKHRIVDVKDDLPKFQGAYGSEIHNWYDSCLNQ